MTNRVIGSISLALLLLISGIGNAWGTAGSAEGDDGRRLHDQQGTGTGGLPASSKNMSLISKLRLTDLENGIADVNYLNGFAYLAAWQPECPDGGIHVVDLRDPAAPTKVGFIPADRNSRPGEGVHVIHVETPSFQGDVLIHNNEACDASKDHLGGVSLWDVTDPTNPVALAEGVGDTDRNDPADPTPLPIANESHSAFGWQAGNRAFVILVDNEELLDVDILEITDPRNPALIAEVGLPLWAEAQAPLAHGKTAFFHDVQVKQIAGEWIALLNYWDAGWIKIDVDDPAQPVFLLDSDYPRPDVLTGFKVPEGNAHQAWFSANNKFLLGTDEDFAPFRLFGQILSADGNTGIQKFTVVEGDEVPHLGHGGHDGGTPTDLVGPTYFVGQACNAGGPLDAAPSVDAIAVIERGTCTFTDKAGNVAAAGYAGGIVFNRVGTDDGCEQLINMAVTSTIPFVFVARSVGFAILGIAGYDPAQCGETDGTNPALPAEGTTGNRVSIVGVFDGWGYLHLLDATSLAHLDAYAIPEALDPHFATDFGDMTVHEIETDLRRKKQLAYASWYDAGARVLKFGRRSVFVNCRVGSVRRPYLKEVGHFIDEGGNDFWGIHVVKRETRRPLLLFSDRSFGLYVLKYTGSQKPPPPEVGACPQF